MLHTPLAPIDDDTEEAPWMVMGSPQSHSAASVYIALRAHAGMLQPPPFVAMMLPIRYHPFPRETHLETLAPNLLVASVPDHPRTSYDVEAEGVAPSLILEVVSPESRGRDLEVKPERYERMGVMEYALFDPVGSILDPPLQGYRREGRRERYIPGEGDVATSGPRARQFSVSFTCISLACGRC